jgi:hypothetical protein
VEWLLLGRSKVLKKVAISALILASSSSSFANSGQGQSQCPLPSFLQFLCPIIDPVTPPPPWPGAHIVPELDVTVGIGALTLIVGGLVVYRSRRRSSSPR